MEVVDISVRCDLLYGSHFRSRFPAFWFVTINYSFDFAKFLDFLNWSDKFHHFDGFVNVLDVVIFPTDRVDVFDLDTGVMSLCCLSSLKLCSLVLHLVPVGIFTSHRSVRFRGLDSFSIVWLGVISITHSRLSHLAWLPRSCDIIFIFDVSVPETWSIFTLLLLLDYCKTL